MNRFKENMKIFLYLVLIFSFFYIGKITNIFNHPAEIKVVKGEEQNIEISFPFSLNIKKDNSIIQSVYNKDSLKTFKKNYVIDGIDTGKTKFELKLLGIIPVKKVNVNVVDRELLIPGGNAVGVKLNTKGVLVVAVTDILGTDGKKYSPAKTGGIKIGDSILEIDDQAVQDAEHVVKLLNEIEDKKVKVVIERNKKIFETEIVPVKSMQDNYYRFGIWVRDKTAGVGTLTFYNDNKSFGALGHGITDVDTGNLLNVDQGKIMSAKVANIEQGKKGIPGEIKGTFYETKNVMGDIRKNSAFGIYGVLNDEFIQMNKAKAIPIGFKEEVREGKAHILTTVDNNKVEKFEIKILKLQSHKYPTQKSMTIKITDKKLLQKTGGIVQGMSGSPIIQGNNIVGAITHVFVNDPTKGYGIYVEWMLEQLEPEYQLNKKLANSINR